MSAPGYELLYDAATGSSAPRSAALVALGLAGAAGLRALWRAGRGRAPIDGLGGFLVAAAALFVLLAGAYVYERRQLATGAVATRVAEGPITGMWRDRTVRAGRTKAYWEGFRVSGVPFVYDLGTEDNYWRNHRSQGGPLGEGARVRLRYVERVESGRVRRHIVRVERAGE
jgi:hypothetical protein